jgi:hypothetical protein
MTTGFKTLQAPRKFPRRRKVGEERQREAACCPFLDYRVDMAGDEVVFTITNPGARART